MNKKICIYRLTDAQGNKNIVVLNDDTQCEAISGYDKDGVYQVYDGDELWYAYDWAKKHGFTLDYASIEVQIPDAIFERTDFERIFDVKMIVGVGKSTE